MRYEVWGFKISGEFGCLSYRSYGAAMDWSGSLFKQVVLITPEWVREGSGT